MQITQNSVGTASVLDALRYCGKQLYKAWVVLSYFYVIALALGLFVFVTYQIHPEWEARDDEIIAEQSIARREAEMKRLAAERKQERLEAAKLAKREMIQEAKRERVQAAKLAKQERLAARQGMLDAQYASVTLAKQERLEVQHASDTQ